MLCWRCDLPYHNIVFVFSTQHEEVDLQQLAAAAAASGNPLHLGDLKHSNRSALYYKRLEEGFFKSLFIKVWRANYVHVRVEAAGSQRGCTVGLRA